MRISQKTREKMELVASLREKGMTFKEVAKQLGLAPQTVSQLFARLKRVRRMEESGYDDPMDELSVRTANGLNNWDIRTKEEALEAITSGRLSMNKRPRNVGKPGIEEVFKWLGLELPQEKKLGIPCRCPNCNAVFFR